MLTVRIIPCLDCRDGRVVKGIQFANLRDLGSPAEHANRYEHQGADEIVLLDVAATTAARANQTETVAAVRAEISIPLTVGGGVRDVASAERLLGSGADKIGVNTAAVDAPDLIDQLAEQFGSQCVVLAIDAARWPHPTGQADQGSDGSDVRQRWQVVTHAGKRSTGLDVVRWAAEGAKRGAGEILLTSWDRDGTRLGYDDALISAVARKVSIPVIASGGADRPEHFLSAVEAGADAVLAASIFHQGEVAIAEVKHFLSQHRVPVRPC